MLLITINCTGTCIFLCLALFSRVFCFTQIQQQGLILKVHPPKAAITCVRQIDRRLSVKKLLNKEIVGSIICMHLLSVNGQVSVLFRTVTNYVFFFYIHIIRLNLLNNELDSKLN